MAVYSGDNLNNLLIGGSDYDALFGYGGNDTLYGYGGNDALYGGTYDAVGTDNDSIYGGKGNDTLYGYGGNDYLDGGTDVDLMYGGTGNDTYAVDNTQDVVTEYLNEGIDTVYSTISYTLGNNLENLTLVGSAYYGYGNSLNNIITGNNANNYLWGKSGNDTLVGDDGNDTLVGDSGNDYLDGGTGLESDSMYGGIGNDTYIVDSTTDVVIENFNEGIDTVNSSSSYTLGDNLEQLWLTGSAYYGYGNSLDNFIFGNDSNNYLRGMSGDDVILGGNGNDYLVGDSNNDYLMGNKGNDTLLGGSGSDTLNGTDNQYFGIGEIDILDPGGASDLTTDLIILGVQNYVYYNGSSSVDYAVIDNFDRYHFIGESTSDRIQISGSLSNYTLSSYTGTVSGVSIINGTQISLGSTEVIAYVDSNGLLTNADFIEV